MIGRTYASENRLSLLTIATVSTAVLMLFLLPTLLAPFASAGQLPLSPVGMDPAVFVFNAPEVCGFIPYDISVNVDEPEDTTLSVGLAGEPSVFVPDLKQGDYATNFFLSNSDQQLETDRITWNFFVEYAGYTLPNGTFVGRPIKRVINMTAELQSLTPSRYLAFPRNGTLAVSCSTINAYGSLTPLASDPLFRVNKTAIIWGELRTLIEDPARPLVPGSILFWKGFNIWNQTKGDGSATTLFPLDIDVVYSYESSSNKIWFQILKDPSRTLPRNLIGRNLEIVVAFRPLNKTQLGNNWFEVVEIDTLIRNAIRDQYPQAADRVILRVIDVDYGVGSSWQVVESLTFREVPP